MTETIELSFVCEDTLGSKLIRWFTHSDFSHVDIIYDGKRIGARMDHPNKRGHTGVQIRPMDYGRFTRDERIIVPCLNAVPALEWLMFQIGKPYDKEGLLRSFLFNAGRSVDWRDDRQWWCSELGMAFLEKALGWECNCPASRISPNDLYLFAGAVTQCKLQG